MTYQADYRSTTTTLATAPAANAIAPCVSDQRYGGVGARLHQGWDRLNERLHLQYRLFQGAALVIPHLPHWLARPLAVGGATLAWALARGKRRHVEANLRHIPGLANDPRRLRWAGRGVFIHSALNYLDFFQGSRYTDAELIARWPEGSIEGYEQIEAALAQGRGLIVFGAHFGDFEAAMSRLGLGGYRLLVPAEHLAPEAFFQLACRMRSHHNARLLAADSRETLREMISALKRNEIILVAFDRYIHGESTLLPFFGAPTRLPTASVAFALRRAAPVMFMSSWRVSLTESHAVCMPLDLSHVDDDTTTLNGERRFDRGDRPTATSDPRPSPGAEHATSATALLHTQHDQSHAQRDQRVDPRQAYAMRTILSALEQHITEHPEQWVSALAHIWDDSPPQAYG